MTEEKPVSADTDIDEVAEASAPAAEAVAGAAEPAEADAADAVDAEPEVLEPRRQSLVLKTGSCDMRVGPGALQQLPLALRAVCAKPRRALLVNSEGTDAALVEECRRLMVDVGYDVRQATAPAGRPARNIAYVNEVLALLAKEELTAEDPVVVVGDADALSGVLFATATWYGGTPLIGVPTTLDGMVEVLATPRYIDTEAAEDALFAKGNVRMAICDTDLLPKPAVGDELDGATLMGRAILVAGSVAIGTTTFSDLALAADNILAHDPKTMQTTIMDISKGRGRIVAASALAQRQGVLYGVAIARALKACLAGQNADTERYAPDTDVCDARLFAEGMRIAARLGAGNKPDEPKLVDLVFAQDGLFEKFGLTEVACVIEPEALLKSMRAVEFKRQNRFMPAIPMDYGRVRLTAVDEELLQEHLAAWCKARKKLARRRFKENQ